MAILKSQFESHLEIWAKNNGVSDLIHNGDVFVVVDKYNKQLVKRPISKEHIEKLSAADKEKLEKMKTSLPSEDVYFSIVFDKRNGVFLIRKKTPIQNMLNIWAIIMIAWALYRWYFQTSMPLWFDEFIAKPFVFILPIYLYIVKIEKKNFFSGVSLNIPLPAKQLLTGIIIGVIFFATGLLSFYMREKSFTLSTLLSHLTTPLWLIIIVSAATSISEEIVSRGFVLKRLYQDSKNMYTSAFFASILFFFMHIPIFFTNQNIVGSALLQIMATDFLFSFAVSFLYIQSKNLYLPIIVHALYNVSIYLFSTSQS
jgi:membrane protease YdiL (CAAX protease family)